MNEHVLNARVTHVDRIAARDGRVAFVLGLDCRYLTLLHFTAGLGSNQVKYRKRSKKGLPESKLEFRTWLVAGGEKRPVDVEVGFVSPLDANAIVSIAELPGVTPSVGDTLEFALVRDGQPAAG